MVLGCDVDLLFKMACHSALCHASAAVIRPAQLSTNHHANLICVAPLSASVARLLEPRRGGDCAERLGRGDVDLRVREVGQTADVVQVEVRDDEVAGGFMVPQLRW